MHSVLALIFFVLATSCGAQSETTLLEDKDMELLPACQDMQGHVETLYSEAASNEAVALNRRPGYVLANWQMVLDDCILEPELRAPCVTSAASVAQLEAHCLEVLDDEGRVEGRHFAAQ